MKKPTKPLSELSERELTEWNTSLLIHKENHLNVISGWIQFFGWFTIISIILSIIMLYSSEVLN